MEAKDMSEDQQGHDVPEDMGDPYPMDADEDAYAGAQDDEHTTPQVRGPGVRQRALQARPPQTKKQVKKVRKQSSRILAKEKQRKALELRKAGVTYEEIAKAVGYKDASGARKAVVRAFNSVITEPVSELRVLRGEQLNHMLMTLWPKVQQGDESAIRTALAVMDKHDALTGANQPVQQQTVQTTGILVIDGNKDDFITAARRMTGLGIQHDGTNGQGSQASGQVPAITQGAPKTRYPPGMGPQQPVEDVVDAVIVEDGVGYKDCPSPLGTVCKDPACPLHYPQQVERIEEAVQQPKKKEFRFGVDPTVKR